MLFNVTDIFLIFSSKSSGLKPIAIIYNTRAGKGRGKTISAEIEVLLAKREILYEVYEDEWPVDYFEFFSVWIIGGDGTINYFINHASSPLPPLAVFKGGTGNDFAHLLYGDLSIEATVERILAAEPRPVDAGICNGRLFINMAGIGFDGQVLKSMDTIRWLGSFVGYYYAIIKTILQFKEPECEIRIDSSEAYRKKCLLVQVANSPTTGGGFKVSPKANINDGFLNLLTCDPLSKFVRFIKLPLIRKGIHLDEPYMKHELAQRIAIRSRDPLCAQLDGDMMMSDHFEINVLPGHLSFLY